MKLYNTLTHRIDDFAPINPPHVGIYSCGPTVYWNQHIGNMYAYVQWDVLVRFLRYQNFKVKWVMNVTDVGHMTSDEDAGEDKMEKGAKREGISVWDLAKKYERQFLESLDLVNIQRPDILCRATEHIQEQIDLIRLIEKNGFAYRTKLGVVLDTGKFPDYAKFARLNLEKQKAGARLEVDPEKKVPWDPFLWVIGHPKHLMQWDSPWGKGFPGWHIECTAMSTKYLGERFDIHTGGKEHKSVHHTNEVAQAYAAFGHQTANYWLHNEWLTLKDEKMGKSLGNAYLMTDLIAKGFDPLAFRYLILTSHYRQGLVFDFGALEAAQTALNRLRGFVSASRQGERLADSPTSEVKSAETSEVIPRRGGDPASSVGKFTACLENDLNTPQALAVIWDLVHAANAGKVPFEEAVASLLDFDRVLGLNLEQSLEKKFEVVPEVVSLLAKRQKARDSKDFALADGLRDEILKLGFEVRDTDGGQKVGKLKA